MAFPARVKSPTPDANGALSVSSIIVLNDTAANLASVVPLTGQLALATDTAKLARGDGSTTFANLPPIHRLEEEYHELAGTASIDMSDGKNHTVRSNALGGADYAVTINAPVVEGQRFKAIIRTAIFEDISLNFTDADILLSDSVYTSDGPTSYDIEQNKKATLMLEAVQEGADLSWMVLSDNGGGAWDF